MNTQPSNRAEEIDADAIRYDKQHPEIAARFDQEALALINSGIKRHSPSFVWARLRHESALGDDSATSFKLNNDFLPWYVRRFQQKHPEHAGFFKTRRRISASRPPVKRDPLTPDWFE